MTMTSVRGVEVPAPPVVPYQYGLFSIAAATMIADPHWRIGIEWDSICGGRGVQREDLTFCPDPLPPAATPDRWCQWQNIRGFDVFAVSDGSIEHALPDEHLERQTRDRLLAGEQSVVKAQLRAELAAAVPAPQAVAITGYTGRAGRSGRGARPGRGGRGCRRRSPVRQVEAAVADEPGSTRRDACRRRHRTGDSGGHGPHAGYRRPPPLTTPAIVEGVDPIARLDSLAAYRTADPDVARVVTAAGAEKLIRYDLLGKFGWRFDQPASALAPLPGQG